MLATIDLRAGGRGMNWDDILTKLFAGVAGLLGTGGLVMLVKSWLSYRSRTRALTHSHGMEHTATANQLALAHIARLEARITALERKLDEASSERLGLHHQIAAHQVKIGKLEGERRELNRRVTELVTENTNLRAAVVAVENNPSHAVIVCSEGGTIVEWSSGARAMFHYDAREVVGHSVSLLVPGRLRGAHYAGMQAAAALPLPYPQKVLETVARTKEQTEIPVKIVVNSWEERGRGDEKGKRMFEAVIKRRDAAGSLSDSDSIPIIPRHRTYGQLGFRAKDTDIIERGGQQEDPT